MFRSCCLLLAALLCGCSKSGDELIGMWVWACPGFPDHMTPRITFSPDGTGLVENEVVGVRQMHWRRLDQGRFTLTQASGVTWAGCLSDGAINIRLPSQGGRRAPIH